MKSSDLTIEERKRLRALLLKEDFRRLINDSGKTDDYIIDTVGYTSVPNVTACFESGDVWKVYDTDDRAQVLDEYDFSDAYSAYANAAERRGLSFRSSVSARLIMGVHISPLDADIAEMLEASIIPVLENTKTIAGLLEGEESGAAAAADAEFLQCMLVYMRFIQIKQIELHLATAAHSAVEIQQIADIQVQNISIQGGFIEQLDTKVKEEESTKENKK